MITASVHGIIPAAAYQHTWTHAAYEVVPPAGEPEHALAMNPTLAHRPDTSLSDKEFAAALAAIIVPPLDLQAVLTTPPAKQKNCFASPPRRPGRKTAEPPPEK